MLHHDRLKPCADRDIPLWLRRKRNKLLTNQDDIDMENAGDTSQFVDNEPTCDNYLDSDSLNLEDLFIPDGSVGSPLLEEAAPTEEQADDLLPLTEPHSGSKRDALDNPPDEGKTTRSGRKTKPPGYLADLCRLKSRLSLWWSASFR